MIEKPEIAVKFNEFLVALQNNLNSSIEKDDAIEMLAEHMITKPVLMHCLIIMNLSKVIQYQLLCRIC